MITCPTCNTQNDTGAAFCDQCGASLATLNAVAAPAPAVAAPSAGTCPVCGAAVMSGDAFCEECGAALSTPAPAAAKPVTTSGAGPAPAGAAGARAARAQILIGNGQSVDLVGKSSYLIGREDQVSGIYPDVDTTRSEGDAAGVSRRHAEIVQQSDQWFLQDLNSTNGTFINNQRVAPHSRQALQSGDQIRLGKWAATFQVN
ncbi:MAG: FHA domain-containing protein [Caldilineaceae bacterium]